MIRLLLDNHLSPSVAGALREKGFDVVALQEAHRSVRDLPDHLLLEEAGRQGRVLATYNVRDFARLHSLHRAANRSHSGIVLISSHTIRQDDIGGQVRALEAFLRKYVEAGDLVDQLIWIRA